MSDKAALEQTKLRKRLDALLKQPDNQICADCRKRGIIYHIFGYMYIILL